MKRAVAVRQLAEADYPAWNDLAAKSPEGSIYATPEYLATLCEATGGNFRIIAAFRGDELVGGVPLYEESGAWGKVVSTRLLLYYCGPVLRGYETKYPSQRTARQLEILGALAEALDGLGYARLRLRARGSLTDVRAFQARGWRAAPTYSYVVPIVDLVAQRERVEQNLRRLIDRCARQGIAYTDDDDFASFFAVHLQLHERKGAPLYLPQPAFERYFRRLKAAGLCRLLHARLPDGLSIASQITLLGRHPIAHTVTAGAHADYLNLGASAFLRWKSCETLAALGYQGNDLTDAALNPVTHFKSQLGGDLHTNFVIERREATKLVIAERVGGVARRARRLARAAVRRLIRRR
ncbi:MAG TPA: GNAT family N-acetyltransferase [Gemmatimonadales bacterium]|nr:GNAT family N-acetyltransferase [Gemmatimonadales bacterium]